VRFGSSGSAFAIHFSFFEASDIYYFVAREEELAGIHKVFGEGGGGCSREIYIYNYQ
jgi:hypothetical protein